MSPECQVARPFLLERQRLEGESMKEDLLSRFLNSRKGLVFLGSVLAVVGAVILVLHFTGPVTAPKYLHGLGRPKLVVPSSPAKGFWDVKWAEDTYLAVGAILVGSGGLTALAGWLFGKREGGSREECL